MLGRRVRRYAAKLSPDNKVRPQSEMPIYRFQIDSPLTVQAALQRIRSLTRHAPGFWQSVRESFARGRQPGVPFIGVVGGTDFHLRRDIRYRNSFLPQVRGHVEATAAGTRIFVKMHLHPIVGVFMLFWLGAVGVAAVGVLTSAHGEAAPTLMPLGMFVFGVALTAGGFYPEAFKARRLLEQGVGFAGA